MSCEIFVSHHDGRPDRKIDLPILSRPTGMVCFGTDQNSCFLDDANQPRYVISEKEGEEFGIFPRHCILIWAGGKFRLDFDRQAQVFINGRDQSAPDWCNPFAWGEREIELKLGNQWTGRQAKAPTFKVRRLDPDVMASLPAKRRVWKPKEPTDSIDKIGWNTGRIKWTRRLLGTLAVAAIIAFGFLGLGILQNRTIATKALQSTPFAANVSRYVPSVGVIGVDWQFSDGTENFVPIGTAWLHEDATGDGWLVSNAHVKHQVDAALFCDEEEAGLSCDEAQREVLVRFPATENHETRFELSLPSLSYWQVHPLYTPFKAEFDGKGANIFDIAAYPLIGMNAPRLGQHVIDELSQREFLPLVGETADQIEVGDGIAVFGYPTEAIPFLADNVAGEPAVHPSYLTQKLNAFSQALGPIEEGAADRVMITHRALFSLRSQSAGGLSGSPILIADTQGTVRVVGMLFGGTFQPTRVYQSSAPSGPELKTTRRVSISDMSFGLDIRSLPEALRPSAFTDSHIKDVIQTLKLKLNGQGPVANVIRSFNNGSCSARVINRETLRLNEALPSADEGVLGGLQRGENRQSLKIQIPPQTRYLVVAQLPEGHLDLTQLTLEMSVPGQPRRASFSESGLNTAFFEGRTLRSERNVPTTLSITVAGPLRTTSDLKLLVQDCEGTSE